MLSNYLKVSFRTLIRNPFYSSINILGLAIGMACVFLIIQYLRRELSYDKFHEGYEDIYRIAWEDANPQTRTPHPMAQAMVHDFPEVQSAVSLTPLWGFGLTRETFSISNPKKNVRYDEKNVLAVDSTFFDVFTFPLLRGDPKTVLKNPGGLLLSESMAHKYFGDEDPIGQFLTVNSEKQLLEVIGVFKDVPSASHFHFDCLVSYVSEKSHEDPASQYYTWNDFGHYNYIRLKPGTDPKALEKKLVDWAGQYIDVSDETIRSIKASGFGFRLQPLADIHLRSHLRWELEANGYLAYVYIMTAAAFLILIIACANFINLTTAQSAERLKEIGVRKTLGAFRRQLALQFTGESLLVSMLAAVIAVILVELAMPAFSRVTGIDGADQPMHFAVIIVGLAGITGIIAGLFPSAYLSASRPGLILSRPAPGERGSFLRHGFAAFQFFASMVLITSSVIIYSQLAFIQSKEIGFTHNDVLVIPVKNPGAINPKLNEVRSALLTIPGVQAVSASSNIPGRSFNQNPVFATQFPESRIACSEAFIDYDFFDVLGISIADGRNFSRENPADQDAFVLNETAARMLYAGHAVGKEFSWDYDAGLVQGMVIGVVKDFNFQSLHQPVKPLLFRLHPRFNYVMVKLNTPNLGSSIASIEKTWKKFDDRFAFEPSFLSDELNQQYALEKNMAVVIGAFSLIAVAVACFGLLGIASLVFRKKTKEISIRKVLGATIPGLLMLLARDFTRMVLVAAVLAVPLVWWGMNQWLNNFAFRTTINPLVFLGSGFLLILIAWGTLSFLTLRVARMNPAETLKTE